jgi:hypothetical protein
MTTVKQKPGEVAHDEYRELEKFAAKQFMNMSIEEMKQMCGGTEVSLRMDAEKLLAEDEAEKLLEEVQEQMKKDIAILKAKEDKVTLDKEAIQQAMKILAEADVDIKGYVHSDEPIAFTAGDSDSVLLMYYKNTLWTPGVHSVCG